MTDYMVGQTKHSIPSKTSAASGTSVLAEGIRQLQERVEAENASKSLTEVKLDSSNKVSFPGFPYLFEAIGEKILVSIDVFKSGYECKFCKGTKTVQKICSCEAFGHAGLKYDEEEIEEIRKSLGDEVANARAALLCPDCNGHFEEQRSTETCPECKGIGHMIILPDESKKLPTTGVVVSMGEACSKKRFKIGDRILFGPYAGNMIPTKAGLMFKILDENQAWCRIEGGEDLAAFDFVIQEKE